MTASGDCGLPPRHILVATDLGLAARNATWRAAQLARAHGATLRLLHVPGEPREAEAARTALAQLAEAVQLRLGVAADVEVARGDPARETSRAALAADLLVVPAREGSSMRERIAGTTTERLVRASRIPVLVVKRPLARSRDRTDLAPPPKDLYDRVLACVDLGPGSADVITAATCLSADPRMEVFHVVAPEKQGARAEAAGTGTAVERARAALRERMAQAGPAADARAAVGFGHAGASVVAKERAVGADLIVLGRRERRLLGDWFLGTVTREVLSGSRCDVLLVPPRPRSFAAESAAATPDTSAVG
ncbi:universal stress protein [Ramlibacter sp. USB13]|uniref:Universal stress protein n=1 Tax=Ramlibacter cellulosilyticus TaxID=2764187 RepID=A0A923MTQ0_9BURK|nr:universal stress protein [Ramlibacter cellulosilyticus]MBC5784593.1 universal stress protein [Ramlibacter cellulosilyticus]